MRKNLLFFLSTFLLLLQSCANFKPNHTHEAENWEQDKPGPDLQLQHTMYLVGDAGNSPLGDTTAVLKYLKHRLAKEGKNSSILFLGDNIYPNGMPPKSDEEYRKLAEHHLGTQLSVLDDFKGRPIFLPGNHDWRSGLKGLHREEKFVEKHLNKGIQDKDDWKNYFLPDKGCPGPEVVQLNDKLVVIVVDSQWWLADWDKEPHIHEDCEIKNKFTFQFAFENTVRKYRSKNVVIAMHHPLYTNGPHGGNFAIKTHLFPLTEISDKLYLPLPGLGTLYAFLRGTIASKQDINHQKYKNLRDGLLTGVKKNGSYIFVAGHEHNIQYLENEFQKFIISGAGSKRSPSSLGKGALFSYGSRGFSSIKFYEDGEAWVEFWVPNKEGTEAKVVFRKKIKDKLSTIEENIPTEFPEYETHEDTVERLPTRNEVGKAGALQKALLGEHYRSLYLGKYKFPVMDLSTFRGGMTPIKRGGGNQTNSLRLSDAEGHQFVMRDLTKDVSRLLPFPFNQMNLAKFIALDNFLATHPFAPLALPPMADAINIYHANPQFYYIPKQPSLGINNDSYGGSVYLVEERPGGNWKGMDVFGGSKKLISTPDLAEKLVNNHKQKVDQPWAVRTRMFDLVIGDWDRHDDQWRWAGFKEKKGLTIYRPVPRDRDQAFSKYDGAITRLTTLTAPFLHQLAVYKPTIRQIKWAAWSPRYFDNSFLNELTWKDWEKEVKYIQEHLTDKVVEEAFKIWPQKAQQETAPHIEEVLKKRRDNLMDFARRYYEFMAKEVDVYGTDKRELFQVERLNDDETRVRVFELSKKGKKKDKLYDRTFQRRVTKEIHIYGIGDDDEFRISGNVNKGIKIRCIGGLGKDLFVDESTVKGLSKKTLFYDDLRKNTLQTGTEAKDKRSRLAINNIYDRQAYHYNYNYLVPFPIIGSNPDDGFLLGANLNWTTYGFNKAPYGAKHKILTSFAYETNSFLLDYTGDFLDAFGKWDFYLQSTVKNESFSFNYFGFGNESVQQVDAIDFYRVRQGMVRLYPALKKRLSGDNGFITIGPTFERTNIERVEGRFLASDASDVTAPDAFDNKYFGGVKLGFNYYNVDNIVIPHRGLSFLLSMDWQANLDDADRNFGGLRAELAFYQNLDRRQNIIFATRWGFGYNTNNDFEFWQAPHLGGKESLRGYRAERFYGKTTFWQNTDLRLRLFSSYNSALPFTLGLFGGFDYGRVWEDNDTSDIWHYDYGGGIWLSPIDAFTFSFGLFQPKEDIEDLRFTFKVGFGF